MGIKMIKLQLASVGEAVKLLTPRPTVAARIA